jgi:hypothetical protein
MDQFPQKRLPEFRYNPANIRIACKAFDALENFGHKPFANLGHTLSQIPRLQFLKIAYSRFGEADSDPSGHKITMGRDAL